MQVEDKTPNKNKKKKAIQLSLWTSEGGCQETYVGEREQSVKVRLQQHRRPGTKEAQNSAVYKHIRDSGH